MNKKLGLDIPMEKQVLTKEDIITIVKYLIELINAKQILMILITYQTVV
jgi:DNA-directed RNA polymerase subunit beta